MLVGLSGPQGGGKSTLLLELRNRGYVLDDFKVSREVQRRLGVDLVDAVSTPDKMMMFQDIVFEVKQEREQQNKTKGFKLLLTERTFADISSYAQLWSFEFVHHGKWGFKDAMAYSLEFTQRCSVAQQIYDGVLILPRMEHVAFVKDPNRASQKSIEFITEQLDRFVELKHPQDLKTHKLRGITVEDRANEVELFLKTLG